MEKFLRYHRMSKIMICLTLVMSMQSAFVQAGLVATSAVIESAGVSYSKEQLQTALASDELKNQLSKMGVDTAQLNDRVASLTPGEISQLNAHLNEQPAGSSVVGILFAIFVLFVITDAICATDLFTFVKCIN
jgi:hypothetical protein